LSELSRNFLTSGLGGSLEPFVAYLAEEVRLSDEERERLQQKVRELRAESGEETP
jgi:hypothetical protein